jgi:hypothetical protein
MCKRIYSYRKCPACGEKEQFGTPEYIVCNAKREIWRKEVSINETAVICTVTREDKDMEPVICKTCEECGGDKDMEPGICKMCEESGGD